MVITQAWVGQKRYQTKGFSVQVIMRKVQILKVKAVQAGKRDHKIQFCSLKEKKTSTGKIKETHAWEAVGLLVE